MADALHDNMVKMHLLCYFSQKFDYFSLQVLRMLNVSSNGIGAATAEHLYELFQNKNVILIYY